MENLKKAHTNARKGKVKYQGVKKYDTNPDFYLTNLRNKLINKTYATSDYKIFSIIDKGKEREIYSLPYEDRVVHWAIMQIVEPIFMATFIDQTYAALPNRGVHKAFNQLDKYLVNRKSDDTIASLNSQVKYCLKIDVKKFFPNVNKEILKKLIRRKFKDEDFLWLMDDIIDSVVTGLPVGNYTSQFLGNFYLSYFDHWIKEEMKVKHYLRYMDDCVFLHHDKEFLQNLKRKIDEYFDTELKITIKENWQVFHTYERGVDFVGYRHFGEYILLRKTTAKALKRKLSRILRRCQEENPMTYSEWCSINSYKGWIKHCDGYNLYQSYIKPLEPYCEEFYEQNIRNKGDKMKSFSEIERKNNSSKISIKDVLDKEIIVRSFSVRDSKFIDEGKKYVLKLNIEVDGERKYLFTGSNVLINQIESFKSDLPFKTTIKEINKYYKFT